MEFEGFLPGGRFLVVGLGLLGARYALGLSRAGMQVDGINRSRENLDFALRAGYIQTGKTADYADLVSAADYIILAQYPGAMLDWAAEWAGYCKPGCLVTDLAGIKGGLVEPLQALMPPGVEFIGSHPMAGRELSGAANAHLVDFAPANFLITPTARNTPRGIGFAQALADLLGFAHVSLLSPAEHDRMIGYVSQLTHAIAVSLMCASDNRHLAEYTGDSFRDLTRIARINGKMWAELFLENRDNLTAEIDQFSAALTRLKEYLAAGDAAGLEAMFALSTERRAAFDRPAGPQ